MIAQPIAVVFCRQETLVMKISLPTRTPTQRQVATANRTTPRFFATNTPWTIASNAPRVCERLPVRMTDDRAADLNWKRSRRTNRTSGSLPNSTRGESGRRRGAVSNGSVIAGSGSSSARSRGCSSFGSPSLVTTPPWISSTVSPISPVCTLSSANLDLSRSTHGQTPSREQVLPPVRPLTSKRQFSSKS